jgi:phage terminase large subunit
LILIEKEYYKLDEKNQRLVLKTTYKDNRYLDEEYTKVLMDLKHQNQNLYRISTLGVWGGNRGIIYTNYTMISVLKQSNEVIYGVDFGFNNPTAVLEIRIVDKEYYIKQLIYETGLTNTDLIKQMISLGMDKSSRMYCDCAEPARIEELKRNGFNAWEADKDVNKGIDFVKSQKLYIDENSVDLIKELKTYSWQENKAGDIIDKPSKEWDHSMDALRYACYTHNKTVKPVSNLIGVFSFDK